MNLIKSSLVFSSFVVAIFGMQTRVYDDGGRKVTIVKTEAPQSIVYVMHKSGHHPIQSGASKSPTGLRFHYGSETHFRELQEQFGRGEEIK